MKELYGSSATMCRSMLAILMIFIMVASTFTGIAAALSNIQEPMTDDAGISNSDPMLLYFKAATYDPLVEGPDLPKELLSKGQGQYLVQFKGPVKVQWKERLLSSGAKILGYIPEYTYMVDIPQSSMVIIKDLPFVRSISPLYTGLKLAPSLWNNGDIVDVRIDVFNDMTSVVNLVRAKGGSVVSAIDGTIVSRILAPALHDIAQMKEVMWIEPMPRLHILNDVSRGILNVNTTWNTHGLNGSGQIVGVADTGLDTGVNDATMHDDLEGRIVSIVNVWPAGDATNDTRSGHGTHVSGSVLGNGSRSNGKIKGVAPGARLYFQALERNSDGAFATPLPLDTKVFQPAYSAGARVHTNSWGSSVSDGTYTSSSRDVDRMVWNNDDMVILFAVGNDGVDSNSDGVVDQDSIDAPATAKNCISVGASEGYRPNRGWGYPAADFPADPIASDRAADDFDGMAAFSSRGPVNDTRIKPDLVAPGTGVLSLRSSVATGTGWGLPNANEGNSTYYMFDGGTSMATPLVAGSAALVRQFYVDNESITPSAALVKATLINGADELAGQYSSPYEDAGPIWDYNQGWGRVNVTNSIFPSPRELVYDNENQALNTGNTYNYNIEVTGNRPLKISLVWTDYYGAPLANPALVNNLDLKVTAPNSSVYLGNNFNLGESTTGGSADNRNNVENVFIKSPANGNYSIDVKGFNVPQGPQDYAIVISGVFSAPAPNPPTLNSPASGAYTNANPTFNLTSDDVNNDDLQYRIQLSKDNFTSIWRVYNQSETTSGWSKWKYASGEDARYSVNIGQGLDDGVKYYWRANAWDGTGWSTVSSIRNFTVDAAAPTGLTISIDSGANSTNNKVVTLTLAATDNDSGLSGGSSGMAFSQDGTSWTNWESYSNSKNLNLEDYQGQHRIYFKAKDAVGNEANAISSTIIYDNVAPSGLVMSIASGHDYTNTTSVDLVVSATDTTSGLWEMAFSNDGSNWGSWETFASTRPGWDLSAIAVGGNANDGLKTVYFRTRDNANNVAPSISTSIILDTKAPIGTQVSINGGDQFTTDRLVLLTLTGNDVTSGVASMSVDVGTGYGPWEPFSSSIFVTLTNGPGNKIVNVKLRDAAGNIGSEATDMITFDDMDPFGLTIVPSVNFTKIQSVTFTLGGEDPDTGIADMSFSFDGEIWTSWMPWSATKDLVLPPGDGIKYVYYRVIDEAGNIGGPIMTSVILDTVGPLFTFTVDKDASYTSTRTVPIGIQLLENGSYDDYDVSFSNDGSIWSPYQQLSRSMSWELSSGDGDKTVSVIVRDQAGNEVQDQSDPIILDTTVPHGVTVTINGGDDYTTTDLVILSLAGIDENGMSYMAFSQDGSTWSSLEPWDTMKTIQLPQPNGLKTVHMRVQDPAGNMVEVKDDIFMDLKVPEIFTFRVNDAPEEMTVYTTSDQVTYSVSAFDEDSNLSALSFGFDGLTWGKWSNYTEEGTLILPKMDGPLTVYLRVKDKAGNIGDPATVIMIMDTTPPGSVSVLLNEGDATTTSEQVTLRVGALDMTSGLDKLRYREGDGAWSRWSTFTTSRTIRLSTNEGSKTIMVEVRDMAGNVAPGVTDSIDLVSGGGIGDLLKIKVTSPSGGEIIKGSVKVTGTVTGGTPSKLFIRIDGGDWKSVDAKASWTYTWSTANGADGPHIIEVMANNGVEDFISGPRIVTVKNKDNTVSSTNQGTEGSNILIYLIIAAVIGAVAGAGSAAAMRPRAPPMELGPDGSSSIRSGKAPGGAAKDRGSRKVNKAPACADCGYAIEQNEDSITCSCGRKYHMDCAEATDGYCSKCGSSLY